MKREDAQKHWKVIEAFKDGKEIQQLCDGMWLPCFNPSFYAGASYRIKPKQVEFGALVREDGGVCAVGEGLLWEEMCLIAGSPNFRKIRVREIID